MTEKLYKTIFEKNASGMYVGKIVEMEPEEVAITLAAWEEAEENAKVDGIRAELASIDAQLKELDEKTVRPTREIVTETDTAILVKAREKLVALSEDIAALRADRAALQKILTDLTK